MNDLVTFFNTSAAPVAIGKLLANAVYHEDHFMIDCLTEDLSEAVENVCFLEACLGLETV